MTVSRTTLLVLAALLVAATVWRIASSARAQEARPSDPEPTQGALFDGMELRIPRGWRVISRSRDHITWGEPAREHTVTLASTQSSVLPLPGVVQSVATQAPEQLPGARLLGRPTMLEPEAGTAPDDVAMQARFVIEREAAASLYVTQVWRRDARSGRDLVATWTSSDGAWPRSPRASLPRVHTSR